MIAETNSETTFAIRIRPLILTALTAVLVACRPGADFKVSVRVIDETTGRPIPDAWVLVSARVDVEPEREPPYNRAIAGARDRTDSRGVAVLKTLEGLYWGEEPKDALWKMLSAREPKVERRITLIKEGDLFVFAKDYGVLHHPLRFKGGGVSKEVPGLGLMGVKGEGTILELDPADIGKGLTLTVKLAKPEDPEYLLGSFSPDSLWLFAGLATTGATGTTKKEKAAVYDFFVENLRPLLERSTTVYQGHMRPESLFDPESREKFINHAPEQVHNHDTVIHEWMTQKALELLPPSYEEVKQYARKIQAGVKAEDEGTRAINHFYNPYDPANAFPLGESALKWGAIGYPDNPNNEWDWHDAQRYYREGDKAKAYKALGHVLHLLEDLSVPMHTHVIAHHSLFQRSAARYELYFGELAKANGGRLPPIYSMDARAPKKVHALADLFDGLAKMTFGTIAGNRTAVDVAAFYKWEKGSMGTQGREPDAAELDVMGKQLVSAGIEHGGGLLVKYFTDLHQPASASVADAGESGHSSDIPQGGQGMTTEPESTNRALQKLFDRLKSTNPGERTESLRLLRGAPRSRAVGPVLALLQSEPDWMVRCEAIRVLQRNGGPELAPTYLSLAKGDSHVFVRVAAIQAISHVSGPKHLPEFRAFLKDGEIRVRMNSAVELARHGDPAGYDFALTQLSNPESKVRQLAADAVTLSGRTDSLPRLKVRLEQEEKNVGVLEHLVRAIHHIELLRRPEGDRLQIIRAGLGDAELRVRAWAVYELMMRGDSQAREILKRAAEDPTHPGQLEAYQALSVMDSD